MSVERLYVRASSSWLRAARELLYSCDCLFYLLLGTEILICFS